MMNPPGAARPYPTIDARLREVGLGTDLPVDEPREPPRPGAAAALASLMRRPPSLVSEETPATALDRILVDALQGCGGRGTGELAWRVAELLVSREAEVAASGDRLARDGLGVLAEMARMFEHVFVASGGAALDGDPT